MIEDWITKNWFANKYGFTPDQVDGMSLKDVEAFKLIENTRQAFVDRKATKEAHLAVQRKRMHG